MQRQGQNSIGFEKHANRIGLVHLGRRVVVRMVGSTCGMTGVGHSVLKRRTALASPMDSSVTGLFCKTTALKLEIFFEGRNNPHAHAYARVPRRGIAILPLEVESRSS